MNAGKRGGGGICFIAACTEKLLLRHGRGQIMPNGQVFARKKVYSR